MTIDDIEGARPSVFRHRKFDRKEIHTNAKYDNMFDQFGTRRKENEKVSNTKIDPLAGSKERRKDQLSFQKHSESDYEPRLFTGLSISRRLYRGIYKNQSNVGALLREARKDLNPNLSVNNEYKSTSLKRDSQLSQNKSVDHGSESNSILSSVHNQRRKLNVSANQPHEDSKSSKNGQSLQQNSETYSRNGKFDIDYSKLLSGK